MKFNNHIYPLLKEYNCVVIPNFGSFVCRNISAKFSENHSQLLPPNKEIVFNKNLKENDGVLMKNISEIKNIPYSESEKKINSWVKKINKKINKGKSISFQNIGSLRKVDKNFIFEPNINSIFLKSSYGLSAVDTLTVNNTKIIKPLSGLELSSELKQHDIYVTGSLNEPSGNHHIEAGLCGLPILYINSGGIPEYTKNFGLEVNINTFEDRLNYMIEYFSNFQKKMKGYPFDSETMCKKYLDLFENQ